MEVVLGRFERKNKINKVIIQINMSVKAAKERYLMIQELKKKSQRTSFNLGRQEDQKKFAEEI